MRSPACAESGVGGAAPNLELWPLPSAKALPRALCTLCGDVTAGESAP